jgi:hypothetical protein
VVAGQSPHMRLFSVLRHDPHVVLEYGYPTTSPALVRRTYHLIGGMVQVSPQDRRRSVTWVRWSFGGPLRRTGLLVHTGRRAWYLAVTHRDSVVRFLQPSMPLGH